MIKDLKDLFRFSVRNCVIKGRCRVQHNHRSPENCHRRYRNRRLAAERGKRHHENQPNHGEDRGDTVRHTVRDLFAEAVASSLISHLY